MEGDLPTVCDVRESSRAMRTPKGVSVWSRRGLVFQGLIVYVLVTQKGTRFLQLRACHKVGTKERKE